MLTAYIRFPQEGIEPLENSTPPVKDKETGHFYFDDFRIALQYYWNEKEQSAGIAIYSFGPNGTLWSNTGEHCRSYNSLASYYYGVELGLEEATRSKAKRVTIYIPDKKVMACLNANNPFKDEGYRNLHNYIKKLIAPYQKVEFIFRTKYPKNLTKRMIKEAMDAARPPEFSVNGQYLNACNKTYSNITSDDQELEFAVKQLANLMYDLHQSYLKDLKEEIGEDGMAELSKKLKSGEINKLPELKSSKAKKHKTIVLAKCVTPNKAPVKCHHCGEEMKIETATMEKPENETYFVFRCGKCHSTKKLNGKGRLVSYGRYPKKKAT